MNFGQALEALKEGKFVAREGWNGKGMFLSHSSNLQLKVYDDEELEPGNIFSFYNGNKKMGNIIGTEDLYEFTHFIVMKTADNKIVSWVASQTDMLSEDWVLVDKLY